MFTIYVCKSVVQPDKTLVLFRGQLLGDRAECVWGFLSAKMKS